jgi:hypothetical protein
VRFQQRKREMSVLLFIGITVVCFTVLGLVQKAMERL